MSTVTEEPLLSACEVEIQAAGKKPTVSIVAYSGGLMAVPGWGPVVIDLNGIDISGQQVGILADHDASLSGIVGHGRATIHNGRTIKSPASGFLFVKASTLREVSIVAIGADASTSVSIAASKKDSHMPKETTTLTTGEIRGQAADETERITAIRRVCYGRFGEIEARAIRDGWDAQRAELEVLRASRPKTPAFHSQPYAATDEVIEAAILSHMGCESLAEQQLRPQTAQQARDLRCTNLVDLCRISLQDRRQGRSAWPGSDDSGRAVHLLAAGRPRQRGEQGSVPIV